MRVAVVARVTDKTWTACAVKDEIHWCEAGLSSSVSTTLCFDSRASRAPIVIEHASADPRYRPHGAPKLYQIESYISVPIIRSNGGYFGNLSALDPKPAKVAEPRIAIDVHRFAALIASQLDHRCCKSRSIARSSMNAPRVNCGSNSLRFWAMICVIPCTRSMPAATCWNES